MKRSTVRLLGRLLEVKVKIWEDQRCPDEWAKKLTLLDTIFVNLEENARGFKKSSLDYSKAGAYLVENKNYELPYAEVHKAITEILLKPK